MTGLETRGVEGRMTSVRTVPPVAAPRRALTASAMTCAWMASEAAMSVPACSASVEQMRHEMPSHNTLRGRMYAELELFLAVCRAF